MGAGVPGFGLGVGDAVLAVEFEGLGAGLGEVLVADAGLVLLDDVDGAGDGEGGDGEATGVCFEHDDAEGVGE